GSHWTGRACLMTEFACPSGAKRQGLACVAEVRCPGGTAWDGASCAPPARGGEPCILSYNSVPNARGMLDDVEIGRTPLLFTKAYPGAHRVTLSSDEGAIKVLSFSCRPGEKKSIASRLDE